MSKATTDNTLRPDPIGGERIKVVRQDRHEVSTSDCSLLFEGAKHEVLNYSTFGFAIFVKDVPNFPREINGARFLVDGIEVAVVNLRHVRSEKLGDTGFKCAFEVIGEPINMTRTNAVMQANQLVKDQAADMASLSEVPAAFRTKVLETRDALERLEEKINALQSSQNFNSSYEIHTFENTVAQIVSQHLLQVLSGLFFEFATIIDKMTEPQKKLSFDFFRQKVRHLIYQAPFAARAYNKPMGYAGDYEMMNHLYRNENMGQSLFAKCLNHYFLNHPYSNAVRNRAQFLLQKLDKHLKLRDLSQPHNILSVACGPARELEALIAHGSNINNVDFHLLDQDLSALREAQRNIRSACRAAGVTVSAKYFHMPIKSIFQEKLTSSYDLIYSAGLFDYFSDEVARVAAKKLFTLLKPGGQLVIGNYTAHASSKMQMELALDWHLIYRSEDDLKTLYGGISDDMTVESEPEGVNLFLVLQKKA